MGDALYFGQPCRTCKGNLGGAIQMFLDSERMICPECRTDWMEKLHDQGYDRMRRPQRESQARERPVWNRRLASSDGPFPELAAEVVELRDSERRRLTTGKLDQGPRDRDRK